MYTSFVESTPILKVSEIAENLAGSEILKIAEDVKERISAGEHIYNFTIGDFDPDIFPIPKELQQEIAIAYKNRETNYPPANGVLALRQAISRFLLTRGQLEYNENQILVAGGARPLIYAAYQTLIDPGDIVISPVPSWNNNYYCHLSQAIMQKIETSAENNFMPAAKDIKPFIQEAKLIALCSPLNPAGTTFSSEGLKEICELVLEENKKRGEMKKPVYLLYDQIYWLLMQGDAIHHDPVSLFPEMKNYTVYVDGLSKAFAATGLRVGWGFGPQKVIDKMKSIIGHMGAWAPRAEQVACANYMQRDDLLDDYLEKFNNELNQRLSAFYNGFQKMKEEGFKVDAITPEASIYLTVQIDLRGSITPDDIKLKKTTDVTQYLLEEAKIALVPFYAFGASKNSNWYRLSVGTASMKDVEGFFANLRNAIEKLS